MRAEEGRRKEGRREGKRAEGMVSRVVECSKSKKQREIFGRV